jgi:hypothetical protein
MGMTKILDTIGDDQPWVGNSVGVEYAKQFGTSTESILEDVDVSCVSHCPCTGVGVGLLLLVPGDLMIGS